MAYIDENLSKNFVYQSFSSSYNIDKLPQYYCTCDYCMNSYLELSRSCFTNYTTEKCSIFQKKNEKPFRKKSISLNSVNDEVLKTNYDIKLTKGKIPTDRKNHLFCFYYFNLWQGELFKAKALEKENEKLETRIKELELKLEKETQQQIRISLEWRKTVTNLVDENKRLKLSQLQIGKEKFN
jgi:hypothetical protein